MPLFHNHMTIELVVPFFEFNTLAYNRLVGHFRRRIIEEVAASDLPGMIFTFVWALDLASDNRFVRDIGDIFVEQGGRVVFAELTADQPTRIRRNAEPDRLDAKPTKRDVERSRSHLLWADENFKLNTDGALGDAFLSDPYVGIDTVALDPGQAAARIAQALALPVREPA